MPFYGYHDREKLYIKVYVYNPSLMKMMGHILESGFVTKRVFQLYEIHIPYMLQVLADYNLQGMGVLQLTDFKVSLLVLVKNK